MTCLRAQIPKGNMPDPPKGTQREYARKIASNSKLKKGKTVKRSVTGLSRSTSTTTDSTPLFKRHHSSETFREC